MDNDKAIEFLKNYKFSNDNTVCPECEGELKLSFEPEDNDIYIWCVNCDYARET